MSHKHRRRAAAASAAGSSHARESIPNQDTVDCRLVEIGGGQVVVGGVAYGPGSAPRSDEGSRIVIQAAVGFIANGTNQWPVAVSSEHLVTSLVRSAIKRAKDAVVRSGRNTAYRTGSWPVR